MGEACTDRGPLLPRGAQAWIESRGPCRVIGLERMRGGAGARRYVRVRLADGASLVWMHERPGDPEILPPALRQATEELPFVTVTRLLARQGLPVPRIHALDSEHHWLLLEDLGQQHLCDLAPGPRLERQREAIGLLARVHGLPQGSGLPFTRRFDLEWIEFELRHFLEHGVATPFRDSLRPGLAQLAGHVAALPTTLCLRDFQSQNLMLDPRGQLRILDYQDALLAPPELDLASLLHDSYLEISEADRSALLELYASLRGRAVSPDSMATLVVQRKCKDFARFRYLSRVKHDFRFERYEQAARCAVLSAVPALPPDLEELGAELSRALQSER